MLRLRRGGRRGAGWQGDKPCLLDLVRRNLSLTVPAEEDAVIHIFVGLGYPHGELTFCHSGLAVQHTRMEG